MAVHTRSAQALLLAVLPLVAQDRVKPITPAALDDSAVRKPALLEGHILNDQTLQGLKRGTIILRPKNGGKPAVAETDDLGKFAIPGVEAGQYTIEARRDGFISAQWGRRGGIRMPRVFTLLEGQEIKDLTFRLQPFAVLAGKIEFDDAEPAMAVPVLAYRKAFLRGHLHYVVAGSDRTNDRGEYRIAGLAPGAYLIAAIYNKPVHANRAGADSDDPLEAPESEMSYSSTFFTSAHELRDAIPINLNSGDELPSVNLILQPVKTMRVRMEVTDACTGQLAPNASVELFRLDGTGYGSIPVNANIQERGGVFVIRGLAPGSYLVTAAADPRTRECPGRVNGRQRLDVSNYPIDDFKLSMLPPVATRFRVTSDDPTNTADFSDLVFHLEPRSGHGQSVPVSIDRLRNRSAWLDSEEEYDLVVDRGLTDEYLAAPYQIIGGGTVQVRIGLHGTQLFGMVVNEKRQPVPGATITLIPDPSKDRAQLYGETYSNEQGGFVARGLAPGRYIAVPWLDVEPCDFYNWESQDACLAVGLTFDVKAGEQKALELKLKVQP